MATRIEEASADPVAAGREALARGAWEEARSSFEEALAAGETAEAQEGLSWAVWWLNDAAALFEAREAAYRAFRAAGDPRGAARMAAWLATDTVDFRGELAVAQGWLGRARSLLEGVEPSPEHGWLAIHAAEKLLLANDTAGARELAVQAVELGRDLGIADLEMLGLATEGLVLVTEGAIGEGMARLDQAAAAALGGEFTESWSPAWCCCYMIFACERARDFDRAAQWCGRLGEWAERARVEFINRSCRAHYAGVLIWRGSWGEAEAELAESAQRLSELRPPLAAEAAVRMAELRRRQGRLDEARALFEEVAEHPLALVGLGELCLDLGDPAGARERAEEYLREAPPGTATVRAAGLELLVRAQAALGDPGLAAPPLEELEGIAERVATAPLRAGARHAAGVVAAAGGDHERARIAFEDATRLFHRSGAPFEAARARMELAGALAGLGRPKDAARELRAAATSLRRIGAEREADRAEELAAAPEGGAPAAKSPLTPRECEVLRLVAEGKGDKAIAAELVLSEHTVHRHVANILAKLGSSSRSAAVAEALRRELI